MERGSARVVDVLGFRRGSHRPGLPVARAPETSAARRRTARLPCRRAVPARGAPPGRHSRGATSSTPCATTSAPSSAKGDDARLLWYFHQAHGTGLSYTVVTVTAFTSAQAWHDFALRLQHGDLQRFAAELDGLRHDVQRQAVAPDALVTDAGRRLRPRRRRARRARAVAVHGGHGLALRGQARRLRARAR